MKRMLSVLLAVIMIMTLLPLQIFAAESAGAALEYSIEGITLYDEEGIVLDKIPEGKFEVGVSIEALDGAGDALMLLAAYTEAGQYQGLLSGAVNEEKDTVSFSVDNTGGQIAKLHVYIVRSFEAMTPLSVMYVYPTEVTDLEIEEAGAEITGGTYQDVTVGAAVCDGDVKLTDMYIRGDLYVKGGGSNTVTIDGCIIEGEIIVDKEGGEEKPRLYLIETPVTNVTVTSPAIIEAADDTATIKTIEASAPLTVQGEGTVVEQVVIGPAADASTAVVIAVDNGGTIESIAVKAEAVIEGAGGTIGNVVAEAPVTVSSDAVGKVEVPETVPGDVTITVTGDGSMDIVVNAPAVSITTSDGFDPQNLNISTELENAPEIRVDGVAAHVHRYGAWAYLNENEHQRKCVDDATHVEETLHIWDEGIVTAEPESGKPGLMTFTCTVCAGTRTEEIPAEGTRQVASPKGIAAMQQTGMSIKVSMDGPDSMEGINYFSLTLYDSKNEAASRMTGITAPTTPYGTDQHCSFYIGRDKFVAGYHYDTVEITAHAMDGYTDAVWTDSITVEPVFAELSGMTYTLDEANVPAPLLITNFGVPSPGFYEIRVWYNGQMLENENYTFDENGGTTASINVYDAEVAALKNGATVKVKGWNVTKLVMDSDGHWTMGMTITNGETAQGTTLKDPADPLCGAEITFTDEDGRVHMWWTAEDDAPAGSTYVIEAYNGENWVAVGYFTATFATRENHVAFTGPSLVAGTYSKVRVSAIAVDSSRQVWFEDDCNVVIRAMQSTASAVFTSIESEDRYKVSISGLTQMATAGWMELAYLCDINGSVVDGGTITGPGKEITYTDSHINLVISTGNYRIREYHNLVVNGDAVSFDLYEGEWKKCIPLAEEEPAAELQLNDGGQLSIVFDREDTLYPDGYTVRLHDANGQQVAYSAYYDNFNLATMLPMAKESGVYTLVLKGHANGKSTELARLENCLELTIAGDAVTYVMDATAEGAKVTFQKGPETGIWLRNAWLRQGEPTGYDNGLSSYNGSTFGGKSISYEVGEYQLADGDTYDVRVITQMAMDGQNVKITMTPASQMTYEAPAEEVSGEVSVFAGNILRLEWTPKEGYTGNYYVNGVSNGTSPWYFMTNLARNATESGVYSFVIQTSDDGGKTLDTWATATDILQIVMEPTATPDLTIAGQADGYYKFVPNDGFTGIYDYVMQDPDGNQIRAWYAAPNSNAAEAPYAGCTFAVREIGWANGTTSGPVRVTIGTESRSFAFTPYDFSETEITITSNNETALTNALCAGGVVKLDSDVSITNSRLARGGDVVLDLNGHTIDVGSSNSWTVESGKKLTIIDSSVAGSGAIVGKAGISVNKGCALVCDGIELARVYTGDGARQVALNNCKVTYTAAFRKTKNISLNNTEFACEIQLNFHDSSAVLQGCQLNGNNGLSAMDLHGNCDIVLNDTTIEAAYILLNGGKLTINSGEFIDDPYWNDQHVMFNFQNAASQVVITGGSFNFDPSAYVAEGYAAVASATGGWAVTKVTVGE